MWGFLRTLSLFLNRFFGLLFLSGYLIDLYWWALQSLWFPMVQRDVVASHIDSGKPVDEEGVEDAFELLHEMNERVRTGIWVGDCFIYNNSSWRLNYCVGGEVWTCVPFTEKCTLFMKILESYETHCCNIMDLGNYNVPFGPPYVLVGISCKSKSVVFDWQRI